MGFTCKSAITLGLVAAIVLLVGGLGALPPQSKRSLSASGEPQTVVQRGYPLKARWNGQALVGIEEHKTSEPLLYRLGKGGHSERIRFAIPEARHIYLEDIDGNSDGTLVVTGVAYATDGKAGTFVAAIAHNRQKQTVIRVWPYCPKVIAVTSSGRIWTAGYVLNEAGYISEGNVVRQFDESGRLLSSLSVKAKSKLRGNAAELSRLRASGDGAAWLTNQNEYIEFSRNGGEVFRVDGPPLTSEHDIANWSLAVSGDGSVVMGAAARSGRWDLWTLEREKRAWVPTQLNGGTQIPSWAIVLGFDGEDLVTTEGQNMLRHYKQTPSAVKAKD